MFKNSLDWPVPVARNGSRVGDIDGYCDQFSVEARDRLTELYERHYPPTMELLMKMLRDKAVLDFGCGPRGSLRFLGEKYGITIDGLDYDTLNDAAAYHSWEQVKGRYDVVLFSNVLEHMHYEESVAHILRAMEKANAVVIVVPNAGANPFIHQRNQDITHVCDPYNIIDFPIMLESHGITIKRLIRSDIYNREPFRVWAARLIFAGIMAVSPFYEYVIVCERGA